MKSPVLIVAGAALLAAALPLTACASSGAETKAEAKPAEASCGGGKKGEEGSCGGDKKVEPKAAGEKAKEGSCGEGSCGGRR